MRENIEFFIMGFLVASFIWSVIYRYKEKLDGRE